jgi:pSer/pThr/pTyr-binding forkhead associated (FHA) protein
LAARAAASAFLILNGTRTIPLDQPVMNIGRRLDNQLVLEDNRVSRLHAQIRRRSGRYMLYDLGSRGGTCVNGRRIVECVLEPGDVIALGGTEIIYGEGIISQVPENV